MHQQKGITPIIAILVILLITIAITGSAWIYISTYYSGIKAQAGPGEILTFTDTNCVRTVNASTARYTIIAGGRVQKIQMNC
jgi:flagellin-like protein